MAHTVTQMPELMVLLIDDDDSFRRALAENLREDGFQVADYAAARELPPLTALGHVKALVTDYDLPGINGMVLAERFHAAYPNVPIIMVTGACTRHLEAQAAACGFLSVLQKPLEYDKLHNLLHHSIPA